MYALQHLKRPGQCRVHVIVVMIAKTGKGGTGKASQQVTAVFALCSVVVTQLINLAQVLTGKSIMACRPFLVA
ncbi:hypothetical protein E2C01_096446 [Portunus trituberculatus]|uniref:Uncharacterized protein n=1 Tax=Portunus trituberculatus TaxID=210409 RepID=A0A5B7K1S1_PORTR|nr:hypothetical protein [Portunus trituberculatus]